MLSKIQEIKTAIIPQDMQRYDTSGDWYFVNQEGERDPNGKTLCVLASRTVDPRHSALILMHELVEAMLCTHNGITPEEVDKFDMSEFGLTCTEPGNHPAAPYYREHHVATAFEQMFAMCLGVDWKDYEEAVSDIGVQQ